MPLKTLALACLLVVLGRLPAVAQEAPKFEFRGAWIATVVNLDWPSAPGGSTSGQQAQLIGILDELKAAGINAVIFQVRSESDALYASELEPWSYWLTGQQGRAPDPFYDPLAFAIEEAHKRGMELHAWINPFRVDRGSSYAPAANHISRTHPEWLLSIGNIEILDPGIPEARAYIVDVVADIATRYDIDGLHYDDYFYPYPPNQITNQDEDTYATYGGGFSNIGDWRRDNINQFVRAVDDTLRAIRPDLAHGVSPFGIWKDGVPAGIAGLDAYDVIYADAVTWMEEGWIDYLVPQLYWPFGGRQDYARLATWWETVRADRHLYIGHGLYRSDPATFGNTLYSANEVPRQVRYNRVADGIDGSVFFRALNITRYRSKGFADSLTTNLYRQPAITPPYDWKSQARPAVPQTLTAVEAGADEVQLQWNAGIGGEAATQFYAVYRLRATSEPNFNAAILNPANLLAVTGEPAYVDRPGIASEDYWYAVTALSPNSKESQPSNVVQATGRATATEGPPDAFALDLLPNYPNPSTGATVIPFTARQPAHVSLRVYDVQGRLIAVLAEGQAFGAGLHTVEWDGRASEGQPVPSGVYFYVLETSDRRTSRAMTVMR